MTDWHQEPITPERAARNRRIILWLAAGFVVACIGVIFFGLSVTRQVRARALVADAAIRSMGWSILCYADAHGGIFPTGDAALADVDPSRAPAPGNGWPATLAEAMNGLTYLPPAECEAAGVTWPSGGANPGYTAPALNAKGNPSGFGTLDTVNEWLAAYARSRVASK